MTYGNNIYPHLSFYGGPKFAQIGNFGLKIYHLATLLQEANLGRSGWIEA
jgi:hypothetical protein